MARSTKKTKHNDPTKWLDNHGDYLFHYAVSRVSGKEIAEDLVQETFLAALKNYSTFDGKSSIRTWLTSILRHKLMDYYRHIYTSDKKKIDFESGNIDDFIDNGIHKGRWRLERAPKDWSQWPDESLNESEFMMILNKCLDRLPDRIATVFRMSQLEEIETKFICKELKISTTNYWVIMHRARSGLRRCLEMLWLDKS